MKTALKVLSIISIVFSGLIIIGGMIMMSESDPIGIWSFLLGGLILAQSIVTLIYIKEDKNETKS